MLFEEQLRSKQLICQDARLLPDLRDVAAATSAVQSILREAYVAVFQGPPFSMDALAEWEAVVRALGEPCLDGEDGATGEPNGTLWTDVRYDPARDYTFRHSATAQPFHTDGAYSTKPVDVVLFYCEAQATFGGETIFCAAETIDQLARDRDAELHRELWERPVPYGKAGYRGRDVPVLARDAEGILINWNFFRVLGEEDPAVESLRQRFHTFLKTEVDDAGHALPLRLQPGEAAFFEDRRVLHGRRAFAPSPRCLWKCGFSRRPMG